VRPAAAVRVERWLARGGHIDDADILAVVAAAKREAELRRRIRLARLLVHSGLLTPGAERAFDRATDLRRPLKRTRGRKTR
jgi:hypothetical protein